MNNGKTGNRDDRPVQHAADSISRRNRLNQMINKEHFALTLVFVATVTCLFLLSLLIATGAAFLLIRAGILAIQPEELPRASFLLRFMLPSCLFIGFLASLPVSSFLLKPTNKLINCINLLVQGNFKVRIFFGGPLGKVSTYAELARSFNKLAEELENTEMLRGDFINNFSHEFKTPIVSIAGFAKLLKRGNLSRDQQLEYLNIIEEESMRLSYMASNVLNLTRVENQSILTDVTEFNLSEQLRSSILLLEQKWEKKQIVFNLNFDEYAISANEELLKQIWINLLDNAIKFSPQSGAIDLDITKRNGFLFVSLTNTGSEIPEEKQKLIFNKFYQADESHSAEGNGIGLAVVKMIAELHGGDVSVKSKNSRTTFTVRLPETSE